MFNRHLHLHVGYLRTVLAAGIAEIGLPMEVSILRSKNCVSPPGSPRVLAGSIWREYGAPARRLAREPASRLAGSTW